MFTASEKAEISLSTSNSSSVSSQIGNMKQTILRGNEVALRPGLDFDMQAHLEGKLMSIGVKRRWSIAESLEEEPVKSEVSFNRFKAYIEFGRVKKKPKKIRGSIKWGGFEAMHKPFSFYRIMRWTFR